jgi:hypothetical protein
MSLEFNVFVGRTTMWAIDEGVSHDFSCIVFWATVKQTIRLTAWRYAWRYVYSKTAAESQADVGDSFATQYVRSRQNRMERLLNPSPE